MQSDKNCHYPSLILISWENISRLQGAGQVHTDTANTKRHILNQLRTRKWEIGVEEVESVVLQYKKF